MVLFGGSTGTIAGDTWVWDGTSWTQRFPAVSPPARFNAAMAYDSARGEAVLFGGDGADGVLGDTWVWDGTTWTERTPASAPAGRNGHVMAYDAARGKVVLYGGGPYFRQDTWLWDGTTWTEVQWVATPPGREGAMMAYDPARGEVVLFGGLGSDWLVTGNYYLDDTWTWNGSTWTEETPAARPPGRIFSGMAYDGGGRLVLTGGHDDQYGDTTGDFNDTWAWDGTSWTPLLPVVPPPPLTAPSVASDTARHEVVVFGGEIEGSPRSGATWTLASAP